MKQSKAWRVWQYGGVSGALAILVGLSSVGGRAATKPLLKPVVEFNRDIRPILSENCFACHGPDHNKRMAGLRLDVRADAIARGAIVPGKPDKSPLIARVFTRDAAKLMPPPYAHKTLTAQQKNLLRMWVAQGAQYQPHWAFVPLPSRISLPSVRQVGWCRNEMDRFILARLEKASIRPSREADRNTWLRRVTLDLTGLPPTPAEADAFRADKTTTAYEHVVDRLLVSPRYGERMALPWLDIARYADSYGYQSDQLCPTWPYRDWVVNAFNTNLPYDKFVMYQLAGDLLPGTTTETRLATAFNRLHRMTNEGGSVAEEWREEGVADRVKTFGTAFLGLTTECARCHDHKYDPVTQRDFYSLAAFFNSIDEHGLYDQAGIVPSPSLLLPNEEQKKALDTARLEVQQASDALTNLHSSRETAFQQWLATSPQPILADQTGRFDFERFDGTKIPNLVPAATRQGERTDDLPLVPGHIGNAASFDGENNARFPELGRFTRQTPFTIAFWMCDSREVDADAIVYQACDGTDTGPYGYDLTIHNGILTARLMRHWPGNAIAVQTIAAIPKDTWTPVAVTYDGSSRASGLKIYVGGKPADTMVVRDKLYRGIGQHTLTFGARFRDHGFKGGQIDELSLFERDLTPLEIAQVVDTHSLAAALTQPKANEVALRDYYLSAIDPEYRAARKTLETARERFIAAEDAPFEIAVMEEMPKPRPTYLLVRGRYDAPQTEATKVPRTAPSGIFPFPQGIRRDRLGLAQWLTLPNHPLTARVEVNRLWAICFGRGLVETQEDFGIQGKTPTHPELLDYLARDFIASGWDVKQMLKRMVLSQTYRQDSALRTDLVERDPLNLLWARGPSYRLSAETIRDVALAAGGLLVERQGGPPVSPYQPGDLWRESNSMSPAYQQSKGLDLYRRSLYTVWKRTAPMPNMTAFDAGSREVCTARRGSTNTPLQALVLLDDPQFVEAARAVGERTLKEAGPTVSQQVRYTFQLLTSREPSKAELLTLDNFYQEQQKAFVADPESAAKLIGVGESKADAKLRPADLAAATVLAQTILNLDATVWKR